MEKKSFTIDDFEFTKEAFGKGQFGSVVKAIEKRSGREIALKIIDIAKIEEDGHLD